MREQHYLMFKRPCSNDAQRNDDKKWKLKVWNKVTFFFCTGVLSYDFYAY